MLHLANGHCASYAGEEWPLGTKYALSSQNLAPIFLHHPLQYVHPNAPHGKQRAEITFAPNMYASVNEKVVAVF